MEQKFPSLRTREVSLGKWKGNRVDFVVIPNLRRLACVADQDLTRRVIVDGVEGKVYDEVIKLFFDSPKSLKALVVQNKEFFRVEMKILEMDKVQL
jgi:hypothetical protein